MFNAAASPPPPLLTNVDLYSLSAPLIFAEVAAESKSLRNISDKHSTAERPGKEFPPGNGERSNSQIG